MYKSLPLLVAALTAGMAAAVTTPNGFTPATDAMLDVVFGSTAVKKPGEMLTKAETAKEPELAIKSTLAKEGMTFMFVMMDLDVSPQQGSTKRRVLLHALETDFKVTNQKVNGSATVLKSSQKGPAPYQPPGPPATDTMAHRYVQLLFEQPTTLKLKASDFSNSTARFNFDINKFMTEEKLQKPVAGNFFMVNGKATGNATRPTTRPSGTRTATGTGSGPRRTTQPFNGTAARLSMAQGPAALLAVLAFVM